MKKILIIISIVLAILVIAIVLSNIYISKKAIKDYVFTTYGVQIVRKEIVYNVVCDAFEGNARIKGKKALVRNYRSKKYFSDSLMDESYSKKLKNRLSPYLLSNNLSKKTDALDVNITCKISKSKDYPINISTASVFLNCSKIENNSFNNYFVDTYTWILKNCNEKIDRLTIGINDNKMTYHLTVNNPDDTIREDELLSKIKSSDLEALGQNKDLP